jgi:murein DD-endopeptidase MepM/ murein hydrolase activator NlpD
MNTPASNTSFASSQPRQAAFLVYINGIEVPAKSVSMRYGVWQVPEMQVEMTADPTLTRLGAEDRIQVAVFFLDDCDVAPGVDPEFRLFGEGEITGWGYRNTPGGRSITFTVINQIAIYTQLTVHFLTTVEDLVGDATNPGKDVINLSTPSSDLIYPLALFTQGLLQTGDDKADFIKRPFDFLYNTVRGMIDRRVPADHQAVPATNFFARWSRLTNFHNKFMASPFFDEIGAYSDNIFPVIKAMQGTAAISTVIKQLVPQIQNAGSIWDMLEAVNQTLLTEIAMIPSMPLVTVELDTSLVVPTDFNEHVLAPAPGWVDQALGVVGGQVQTFSGTPITGLINGNPIGIGADGTLIDAVTKKQIKYADTLESADAKINARKWVSTLSLANRQSRPKRIPNYFVKPQCFFAIPPACNAIFPSQLLDMSYEENYATQPTRLYFNDGAFGRLLKQQDSAVRQTVMDALAIGYPPEVDLLKRQQPNAPQFNANNFLLFPEEFFKGPVMDRREIPPWMFFLSAQEAHADQTRTGALQADGSQPPAPPRAQTAATPAPQSYQPTAPINTPGVGTQTGAALTLPLPGRWVWPVAKYNGRQSEVSQGFDPGAARSAQQNAWGRGAQHPGQDIMFRFKKGTDDAFISGTVHRSGSANRPGNYFMPDGIHVLAVHEGIIWSARLTGVGWTVVIDHSPLPLCTYYTHMSQMFVQETTRGLTGQRVVAGQSLGIVGGNPATTDVLMHLHFEMWVNGGATAYTDPAPFQRAPTWEHISAGQSLPAAKMPPATPQAATSAGTVPTNTGANAVPAAMATTASAASPAPAVFDTFQAESNNVYKQYAKFEFFRERYAKRTGSASIAWNPYVVPGYPAVILDQRASRVDLFCYVTTVQQTMSHNGRRSTQLSFSYGRQLQEMFQLLNEEFTQNDATARGAAPQEPIYDISKVLQSFPQAETYYQKLFYGAQRLYDKDASFDFRKMLAFAPKVAGASPEALYVEGPDAATEDSVVQATQRYADLIAQRPPFAEKVVALEVQIASLTTVTQANTASLNLSLSRQPGQSDLPANESLQSTIRQQENQSAITAITALQSQLVLAKLDLASIDEKIEEAQRVMDTSTVGTVSRVAHNLGGNNALRELVPTRRAESYFNNRDAAMRYNWRPICTLDEYIIFYNAAGENVVRAFGDKHSVGARYFERIRRIKFQDLPATAPSTLTGIGGPVVTGLNPDNFSQTRSDWDSALLAYRNNVLAIKTPRT